MDNGSCAKEDGGCMYDGKIPDLGAKFTGTPRECRTEFALVGVEMMGCALREVCSEAFDNLS